LAKVVAAETGSLIPRTVHTNEFSEPAGIIPIGS
jgi:Tfp pilus assembly pilus retraction ATPase PilT